MRLHPRSVRTATLSGVVPAQNDAPTDYGIFAQAAFDRYAEICRATSECAAKFPDPVGDLARARRAIESAHAAGSTTVAPGLFGELVRMQLYSPQRVAPMFRGLAEAATGNFSFWEERARGLASFWSPEAISLGTFLSVTCADFTPRVDLSRARRRGRDTFAGSYRADQQAAACAEWRVPPTPESFASPVRSRVPTLLLSGDLDPVTPPAWGELARRTLPNARHVIFRNNGHGLGPAAACGVAMMSAFIQSASAAMVDAGCAEEVVLPPLAGD
jgi:pimeloyl-ACP methyl ester carboxylesterase